MNDGFFSPSLLAAGADPFQYQEYPQDIFNRTGGAIAIGDLLMFDQQATQAETTDGDWSSYGTATAGGVFANAVLPADTQGSLTGAKQYFFFVLALTAAADNASFRGLKAGKAKMNILPTAATSTDTFAQSARITATDGQLYGTVGNGTVGAANKTVALLKNGGLTYADGTVPANVDVFFNGATGFPSKT